MDRGSQIRQLSAWYTASARSGHPAGVTVPVGVGARELAWNPAASPACSGWVLFGTGLPSGGRSPHLHPGPSREVSGSISPGTPAPAAGKRRAGGWAPCLQGGSTVTEALQDIMR